jgi:tRNA A37 threonylcarbamoyladenosine synthetase subunit TsaC/SUA5/YrdC
MKGGLIVYPTDTVYGLGCDIFNTKAVEKVARIKGIRVKDADFSFICHDFLICLIIPGPSEAQISNYQKEPSRPFYLYPAGK